MFSKTSQFKKAAAVFMLFAFLAQPLALCLPTQAEAATVIAAFNQQNISLSGSNSCASKYAVVFGAGSTEFGAFGCYSGAFGYNVSSNATAAFAFGYNTKVTGTYSFAAGYKAQVSGKYGVAFGYNTCVSGANAFAIGQATCATNQYAVAMGYLSYAKGKASFAGGTTLDGSSQTAKTYSLGTASFAYGAGVNAGADYAVAMGYNSAALGAGSVAMGQNALAATDNSFAFGGTVTAGATNGIALGYGSCVTQENAIATGKGAQATGKNAIAMGLGAYANQSSAIAIGTGACATGMYAVATGFKACATEDNTVATGNYAVASAANAAAYGYGAKATATNASAYGKGATASGADSVAMGSGATAAASNSVALGAGSVASAENEVSVGSSSQTRAISNVTAKDLASGGTYAATTGQVYTEQEDRIAADAAGDVKSGTVSGSSLTFKNAAGTELTTVDMSALTTTQGNTNATNISNEITRATAAETVKVTNKGVTTGNINSGSGIEFIAGSNVTISADATKGTITIASTGGGSGSANAVEYDVDGSGEKTNTVTLEGKAYGDKVKITNAAAGSIEADSTDVVVGSQLNATNAAVAGKQDALSTAQLAAADSGITAEKVAAYDGYTTSFTTGTLVSTGTLTVNGTSAFAGLATFNAGASMNNNKITNLANGTDTTDAVNYGQITSLYNNASYSDGKLILTRVDGTDTQITVGTGGGVTIDEVKSYASITAGGKTMNSSSGIKLVAGSNVTITSDGTDTVTIAASDSGSTNAVKYDTDGSGVKTNTVTLEGKETADKVKITNLADGEAATDAATFGQVDAKADKATTLAGYGITDAYTKTEADGTFAAKSVETTVSTLQTYFDANGVANKAAADGDGNNIVATYATKTELSDATTMKTAGSYFAASESVTTALGKVDTQVKKNADAIAEITGGSAEFTATSYTAGTDAATKVVIADNSVAVGGDTYISNAGLNANDKAISNVAAQTLEDGGKYAATTGQLYTEQQARLNADETLQTNIDNETAARIAADVTNGAVSGGSLTLKNEASTTVATIDMSGLITTQGNTNATNITNETNRATKAETVKVISEGITQSENANSDGNGIVLNAGKNITLSADGNQITINVDDGISIADYTGKNELTFKDEDGSATSGKIVLKNVEIEGTPAKAMKQDDVEASATGTGAIAFGYNANATGNEGSVALGYSATASDMSSIAVGNGATAAGVHSIAIGVGNVVTGDKSGAFGDPNTVSGGGSYAVGNDNTITGNNTFVLGNNVTAAYDNSVVLGDGSTLEQAHSVTTERGTANTAAVAGKTGVVSVGAYGNERQIQHVAAGELSPSSTDAVNGAQLYEVSKEGREIAAMSAALAGLHYLEPTGEGDDKVTGAVAYGGYRGENAAAVGIAYKPSQNIMFSASTSIGNSQQSYNAGMSFRFGKGETGASRASLQKQVKYLNEKLQEQGAENAQLKAENEQQDATIKSLLDRLEALEKKVK